MRPHYLEIAGLQSFKDKQVIDFDRLGETGLFGIFGPTGSGKSTVLDAITLSLYGSVQRAARGTQGIINTDSDSVKVAFTFDLLREGLRKAYRVERTYRRKKDSENSAEAKTARLFEVVDGIEYIMADKPGDVTVKVEELLGLQLDDFTRSVVLPQNKFQEFLLLEKAKKREMLERIFYLEEYGRQLIEKVSRKLSMIKLKLSELGGAMSALGDASEKALLEAEKNMQSAYESKERIDKELNILEAAYNEAKTVWDIVNELKSIMEKENEHLLGVDEMNCKRRLFENSIKAEQMTDVIFKYKEADKNLTGTVSMLDEVSTELAKVEEELISSKACYERHCEQAEREKPILSDRKVKLNSAAAMQKEALELSSRLELLRGKYLACKEQLALKDAEVLDRKNELEASEKRIQECGLSIESLKIDIDYRNRIQSALKLENELSTLKNEREKHSTRCNKLRERIVYLTGELGELSGQREKTQDSLEQLKLQQVRLMDTKPGDRNEIMQAVGNYHTTCSVFSALKSKAKDIEDVEIKQNSLSAKIKSQKGALAAILNSRKELEAELGNSRLEIEKLKDQFERNAAHMLAKTLTEGEPCPVCGSASHPVPAVWQGFGLINDTEEQLKQAQILFDEIVNENRKAENDSVKLDEQINGLNDQLCQGEGDLIAKEKEYWKIIKEFPDYMQDMELNLIETELVNLRVQNEKKLEDIGNWETLFDDINNSILRYNEVLSAQSGVEQGKAAELQVNKASLVEEGKFFNEANIEYESCMRLFNELIKQLKIDDVQNELKRIEKNDREVENLRKEATGIAENSRSIREMLEKLLGERQQMASEFIEIDADGRNLKALKIEKDQKVRELAGESNIEGEIRAIDDKINWMVLLEKQLFESVKKLEVLFNESNIKMNTLYNQRKIYLENVGCEWGRLKESLLEKGFETIIYAEQALLKKEQRDELDRQIREYDRIERNIQAQREILQKKLDNRNVTEEEWLKISEVYFEKKQDKEDGISRLESAKNSYRMVKNSFEKWIGLDREFRKHSKKCEILEQIQKLLKGNSFIEFISEERLRYVAKEASETLGILTKFRYALEIDTENGFIIRDNSNGGAHRLVSSLSGGETFLTSLSLALALSKQIQLKGQSPLEFFFLDEGFGMLDSNLLDTVVDSLEKLSTKDRVIGLISHVPELKNRMSRRLIIEPPASQGYGSRVRIEKA